MNELSVLEIVTIVAIMFGCAFALTRTGNVPRQIWRGPVAAFGCGILSLGVSATTQFFFYGLASNASGSRATRDQVFAEILGHAWRPLAISVIGLLLFVLAVRSASLDDDERAPNVGGLLTWLMVLGTAASLVGMAGYLGGFLVREDPTQPTTWMIATQYIGLGTVLLCAIGGLWTGVTGSSWQTEDA
jgi:hypothetical protein